MSLADIIAAVKGKTSTLGDKIYGRVEAVAIPGQMPMLPAEVASAVVNKMEEAAKMALVLQGHNSVLILPVSFHL